MSLLLQHKKGSPETVNPKTVNTEVVTSPSPQTGRIADVQPSGNGTNNPLPSTPLQNGLKGNLNSFLKYTSSERPKPVVNPNLNKPEEPEPEKEEEKPTEEKPVEDGVRSEYEVGASYYMKQGEFASDMTDLILPKAIAMLNGEKDADQYCVDGRTKKEIAKAYARYLEYIATQLSPGAQLVTALGMGYGIPIGASLLNKGLALWNKKQEKENEADRIALERERLRTKTQHPIPDREEEVTPLQPKEKTVKTKECLHESCNRVYPFGDGFGKGKRTKYYDKFCSKGCMSDYISELGQKAKQNNKK